MRSCPAPHGLVFPGQGLHHLGMGRVVCRSSPAARATYERASERLGWDIGALCTDGPAARLNDLRYAQVAVYVTSLAVAAFLTEQGLVPVVVAGHSVGEISALAFCGAVDPDDGLALVDDRARLMAEARADGSMLAVTGMTAPAAAAVCERLRPPGGLLCVAADNAPRHVAVSGTTSELRLLADHLAGRRGVRTTRIRASGPFHSAAYAGMLPAWSAMVAAIPVSPPRSGFVSSVTGTAVASPELIREALVVHLTGMVRWREAMEVLPALGTRCVVEAAERPGVVRLARATLGRRMSSCPAMAGAAGVG